MIPAMERASNIANVRTIAEAGGAGRMFLDAPKEPAPEGAPGAIACCNMNMRMRRHKRVKLAESVIAGWGVFLLEDVKKNEYIGEYVGEVVSQNEADRRGKAYDRQNMSFLFNLNDDCVIDACIKGNKLKFANHDDDANCQSRGIIVDGEHRLGIYAKRDIKAGSELFYNYRYTLESAPEWAMESAAKLAREEHGVVAPAPAKRGAPRNRRKGKVEKVVQRRGS